ncbi:MAG: hypothetical protein Greene07144_958, partial [Parcubacteria group bacterium Greene0714_4]
AFNVQGILQASSTLLVGGTGTSTFAGGISTTRIAGTTASSTLTGLTLTTGGLRVATLTSASCDLKADSNGNVTCGTDASVAGGAPDEAWDVFANNGWLAPTTHLMYRVSYRHLLRCSSVVRAPRRLRGVFQQPILTLLALRHLLRLLMASILPVDVLLKMELA